MGYQPENQGLLPHRSLDSGTDEPGPMVAWTADDGYTTQPALFTLLTSKGLHGTLFLTKNWVDQAGTNATWGDTYITTAQVRAIVAAGHELATHGVNHENHVTYLASNGADALEALVEQDRSYIESTFGVRVKTGAYPAGQHDKRVREVMARHHEFYRATAGMVTRGAEPPYAVPAIDVLALTEAAIKAYVDTAVANRTLVVFLMHAPVDSTVVTKLGNVMDYATSLGVTQGTFYDCMRQLTRWRTPGASVDAQGRAFHQEVHTRRVVVSRDDTFGDYWYLDIDEATNEPYVAAPGGNAFRIDLPVTLQQVLQFTTNTDAVIQALGTGKVRIKGGSDVIVQTRNAGGTLVDRFRVKANGSVQLLSVAGTTVLEVTSAGALAFFAAAGGTKPTVTGSRADGTALASLLTALSGLGLLVDSSTA